MQELGQKITYHKLTDEEFLPELKKKLLEEAQEFDVAYDDPWVNYYAAEPNRFKEIN